jgi:hypothetical protein
MLSASACFPFRRQNKNTKLNHRSNSSHTSFWNAVRHHFQDQNLSSISASALNNHSSSPSAKKIAHALCNLSKNNPRIFWKIMQSSKLPSKPLLPSAMINNMNQILTTKQGIIMEWRNAAHKYIPPPSLTEHDVKYQQRTIHFLNQLCLNRSIGTWGEMNITFNEFSNACKNAKKTGAPGLDNIPPQLLFGTGNFFQFSLYLFFRLLFATELLPSSFTIDLRVPIHKRNSHFLATNYRQISLHLVVAKLFQRIITTRLTNWLSLQLRQGSNLLSSCAFGGIKKRDRFMPLFIVQATIAHDRFIEGPGVWIAAADILDAFPSLWRAGADVHLHKLGIRGKMWRLLRLIESNPRGKYSLNGRITDEFKRSDGVDQGHISAAIRWVLWIQSLLTYLESLAIGYEVAGLKIPTCAYIDDLTQIDHVLNNLLIFLTEGARFGKRRKFSWKNSKLQIAFSGPATNKNSQLQSHHLSLPAHLQNPSKRNSIYYDSKFHPVKKTAFMLGEFIGDPLSKSIKQYEHVQNCMKAATHSLSWLNLTNIGPRCSDLVGKLFLSLIQSIASSHLIFSELNSTRWLNTESIKASLGKKLLGISKHASNWATYAELGWFSVKSEVRLARLLTFFRLKRNGTSTVQHLLHIRFNEVNSGDISGFLHLVHKSLLAINRTDLWNLAPYNPNLEEKRSLRKRLHDCDIKTWQLWSSTHGHKSNNINITKSRWYRESYFHILPLSDPHRNLKRRLYTSFRLGVTTLRASKASRNRHSDTSCSFCLTDAPETELHLLLECKLMLHSRSSMWSSIFKTLALYPSHSRSLLKLNGAFKSSWLLNTSHSLPTMTENNIFIAVTEFLMAIDSFSNIKKGISILSTPEIADPLSFTDLDLRRLQQANHWFDSLQDDDIFISQ